MPIVRIKCHNLPSREMTAREAIEIAARYGLEFEVENEIASGCYPKEALDHWVK